MTQNNGIDFDEIVKALNREHVSNEAITDDGKRTYTVTEIQDILGVSRPSAYNIIASGVFRSVRVGSRIRVSKKSFDEWLDQQNCNGEAHQKQGGECA